MVYLMNSAVMPAGNHGVYHFASATLDDLAAVMRGEHGPARSCIGYPQTAALIEQWTGLRPSVSRAVTHFNTGDRAIVMRLRYRVAAPATKGAVAVSANPSDWEFAWVTFEGGAQR